MSPSDPTAPYPEVPTRPDFSSIERQILDRWSAKRTFETSIERRAAEAEGGTEYVFNDGPPFANGLPHYGHLLTGYVKDVVPRYQTMRGNRVERRFGWDCHGLPAEMATEKETGISGRQAITEYGIAEFNAKCRASVLRYTSEWKDYVTRQARWVDFDNDYKTMDLPYMESVLWAFKQLWEKGLVYEAYRVMPYSWGAQTPLANFEIRLDDATRPRQDPALTVGFSLEPRDGDPGPMQILAWTTTPWTLPSNLALAVGPRIEYVIVADPDDASRHYVLAEACLDRYRREFGADAEPVGRLRGAELVGRTYEPMFPYFAEHPGAFVILGADFVDTGEGTGVVHLAPGFGEDDQRISEAAGIELVVPVDDEGRFTSDVGDYAGQNVFDANADIIRDLKSRGVVVRHETYDHNYPHCWRTDTPIIYRAINSWYVRVTDLTDRLLAANQQINWIPEHVRDGQFGKWLEGARDWSISRNRFWGAPIPVWRSDDPAYPRIDVYGSLDEIEADFGVRPDDLHRPFVDELVRPNPDDPTGKSMMRRVPEVLDCWFESGSMPFAQHHYPFENVERFERHNPADFIVEYIAQTRGWFYTMHVLSVALFDSPAFANVICHGVLLDGDGRKLSKRLGNRSDPLVVFDTIGSDALRWYLMSSPILRGLDLRIDADGSGIRDVVRQVLNPIWSAYSFFTLYANAEGYRADLSTESTNLLDRYVLAKTHEMVTTTGRALDAYDLAGACAAIQGFLDALTNWYIRRSRERFWNTDVSTETDRDALNTLYTVLVTLTKTMAPLLPLVAEEMWLGLTAPLADGDEALASVHLQDWPDPEELPADPELVAAMDRLRDVASAALSLRDDHGLRVRLPLAEATVAGANVASIEPFVDLLADEINVKAVAITDDVGSYGAFRLRPNGRVLGPKLGPDVQEVIKAAKAGEWSANDDGTVTVAGRTLQADEFELGLDPLEGVTATALPGNDAVVVLDTDVSPELEAEGLARDLVRFVQQLRKERELAVTDRIELKLHLGDELRSALTPHLEWVASQVLATRVVETTHGLANSQTLGGDTVGFGIEPVTDR
ncbi:MAG: isoleucine--tRNA ligase [Acidimicrobiia bacterium]|nr:isoleucine--tRNA ligase [Acidimicrobiia bacterium]